MRERLKSSEIKQRIINAARNLSAALGKVQLRGENFKPNPLPPIDQEQHKVRLEHQEQLGRVKAEIRKGLGSEGK